MEKLKHTVLLIAIASSFVSIQAGTHLAIDYPWTWNCNLETMDGPSCQRKEYNNVTDGPQKIPINICWLTCGSHGSLWPFPTGATELGETLTVFNNGGLRFVSITAPTEQVRAMIDVATNTFRSNVNTTIPEDAPPTESLNLVEISLVVRGSEAKISLESNESYSLAIVTQVQGSPAVETVRVTITAETYFGLRHGLETLTQLIDFNAEIGNLQIVNNVTIEDKPAFKYRGLLLDTARNFHSFASLRRMVDALSYNKMNVLHWHLTDSNSFPFESKRVPKVTQYGTFDEKKIYRPDDITEFIQYANLRGVKILVELDAPSHAGNGFNWGPSEGLGELSLCVNAQPYRDYCIQPPCGQLNPINPYMYTILGELYKDFLDVFDRDIFHMGGDEISFSCWLAYPEIVQWLSDHNSTDLMDLWGIFQTTAFEHLKLANFGNHIDTVVWTSEMTNRARNYLSPEDYIIQIWSTSTDEVIKDILNDDYRVIFSNNNTMYLDHGFGPWRGTENKAAMIFWQTLYGHDILQFVRDLVGDEAAEEFYASGKLYGGEATLWTEKGDELNMDMKLWPRGAALGERLWSNPQRRTRDAYPRLIHQRLRMVARGIQADTLLPEACYYIWGFCDDADPADE